MSLSWPLVSQAAKRHVTHDDKLAIGIIGAGGRGWDNLQEVQSERIVAISDVDDERASEAFKKFPDAVRYRDFREMLDKVKSLDAVVISTPDHVHATAAITAMRRGCTSIARSRWRERFTKRGGCVRSRRKPES